MIKHGMSVQDLLLNGPLNFLSYKIGSPKIRKANKVRNLSFSCQLLFLNFVNRNKIVSKSQTDHILGHILVGVDHLLWSHYVPPDRVLHYRRYHNTSSYLKYLAFNFKFKFFFYFFNYKTFKQKLSPHFEINTEISQIQLNGIERKVYIQFDILFWFLILQKAFVSYRYFCIYVFLRLYCTYILQVVGLFCALIIEHCYQLFCVFLSDCLGFSLRFYVQIRAE